MAYKNKEDQRKYHKEWYQRNHKRRIDINRKWTNSIQERVREYKRKLSCVDCGYPGKDHPQVIDFDHLFDKKFQISGARSRSFEAIMEEIKKCEAVCANCHRIRTEERRKIPE